VIDVETTTIITIAAVVLVPAILYVLARIYAHEIDNIRELGDWDGDYR
jgi:hypothetical protein